MKRIDEALYSYSQRGSKDPSIAIEGKMSAKEEDEILDSYPELINDQYRGWFINRLRALKKNEFVKRADRAMKYGRNRQKLFVDLIK